MKKLTALALAVAASVSLSANAGIVTNDTELLSAAGHQQFSEWLGQDVDLTRIFAKKDGDTSHDWHATVDSAGATLTLVEIFNGAERMVVGGYTVGNFAGTGYYRSYNSSQHFLMNLTRNDIYRKNQANDYAVYRNQYNIAFGAGHDLYINTQLHSGYADIGQSYGDSSRQNTADYQEEFIGSRSGWLVGKLETFTLSTSTGGFGTGATASIDEQGNVVSSVDVSAPLGFAALGLAGLLFGRRKKSSL